MKKLIVLSSVLVIAGSAFAQGSIGMANTSTTLVQYQAAGGDIFPVPPTGGKVELLWAPLGTIDPSDFNPVANSIVTINPVAGRFSKSTAVTIPAGSGFTGIAPGAVVSAILRGWMGSAPDWNTALLSGNLVGYSSIFQVDTGDTTSVPVGTPGSLVNSVPGQGFPGLVLVPEPGTTTLFGLGAAAFAFSRRARGARNSGRRN